MITTRREVNIDNGATELRTRTVQRISPETKTVSINATVDVPTEAPVSYHITPRREPKSVDELMPTVTQKTELTEKKDQIEKLSPKAKAMLGVYAAAAIILALIVMFTGLAITNAGTDVAALESELAVKAVQLTDVEAELDHYSDELTIAGAATEMGMVKSDSVTEVELIELGEKADYAERTNGFDKVCDFVSDVFGG